MGEESLEMGDGGVGDGVGDSPNRLEKLWTARSLSEAGRTNISPSGKLNPDSD